MNKPIISDNFTIEDIHKLREYLSLKYKDVPIEDLKKDLKQSVDRFNERIRLIRETKGINVRRL